MSSFRPFATPAFCPVADKVVTLSGYAVPDHNVDHVMGKFCSNCGACLANYAALEDIEHCLLHGLRPPEHKL